MRIDNLSYSNAQTQGTKRREWLRRHAPQHLEHCSSIMLHALQNRASSAAQNVVVLGAGACTEVPLADLARVSDEVVLVDLDLTAMRHARDEITSSTLNKRIRLVQCDMSGARGDVNRGISANLARLMKQQDWSKLLAQDGVQAVFDTAALCLEQCPVPDPPAIPTLGTGSCGLIISSLVLSQLFSYPLLDLLDQIKQVAPEQIGEQERHRHYQEAAQAFRLRVITAHLHLMRDLLDVGGCAALLSDIRGFAFSVHGTDHDTSHRRGISLVPRLFPEHVREVFDVAEEKHWEWISDLPENQRLGRGYEVVGYVLQAKQ